MFVTKDEKEITTDILYNQARIVLQNIQQLQKISISEWEAIGFEELYHQYSLVILEEEVLKNKVNLEMYKDVTLKELIGNIYFDVLSKLEEEKAREGFNKLFSDLNRLIHKPKKPKGITFVEEGFLRRKALKDTLKEGVWYKIRKGGKKEEEISQILYNRVSLIGEDSSVNLFTFSDFCFCSDFPIDIYTRLSENSQKTICSNTLDADIPFYKQVDFVENFLAIKDFPLRKEKRTLMKYGINKGIQKVLSGEFNRGISELLWLREIFEDNYAYDSTFRVLLEKALKKQKKPIKEISEEFSNNVRIFLAIDISKDIINKQDFMPIIELFTQNLSKDSKSDLFFIKEKVR